MASFPYYQYTNFLVSGTDLAQYLPVAWGAVTSFNTTMNCTITRTGTGSYTITVQNLTNHKGILLEHQLILELQVRVIPFLQQTMVGLLVLGT